MTEGEGEGIRQIKLAHNPVNKGLINAKNISELSLYNIASMAMSNAGNFILQLNEIREYHTKQLKKLIEQIEILENIINHTTFGIPDFNKFLNITITDGAIQNQAEIIKRLGIYQDIKIDEFIEQIMLAFEIHRIEYLQTNDNEHRTIQFTTFLGEIKTLFTKRIDSLNQLEKRKDVIAELYRLKTLGIHKNELGKWLWKPDIGLDMSENKLHDQVKYVGGAILATVFAPVVIAMIWKGAVVIQQIIQHKSIN